MAFDPNSVKGGAGLAFVQRAYAGRKPGDFGLSFGTTDTTQAAGALGIAFGTPANALLVFTPTNSDTLAPNLLVAVSLVGRATENYVHGPDFNRVARNFPLNTLITLTISGTGYTGATKTFTLTGPALATITVPVTLLVTANLNAYRRRRYL